MNWINAQAVLDIMDKHISISFVFELCLILVIFTGMLQHV